MKIEDFEKIEQDVNEGKIDSTEHEQFQWLTEGLKEHYDELEIKDMLADIHAESKSDTGVDNGPSSIVSVFNLRMITRIAAAILVLLIPTYVIYGPGGETDLYGEYYSTYPNLMVSRSTSSQTIMDRAGEAYSKGDFEEVYTLLRDVDSPQASFYRAISLMELERFEEAVSAWERHLDNHNFLEQPSKYYLALAYLKMKDVENCKSILSGIGDSDNEWSRKAQSLLLSL